MKRLFPLFCLCLLLVGCRESVVSTDPALALSFSKDTVLFDTVFSEVGSSTLRLMVRNPNKNALRIEKIAFREGKYFHVNVDGESSANQLNAIDMDLRGGDSLYVFVRAYINPQDVNSPVFIEDELLFSLSNERVQKVVLEAYGQNVEKIQSRSHRTDYQGDKIFKADKPYLIYDTLVVGGKLTIEAGTQLYFHSGASLWALGDVEAVGTLEQPITLRGDRLDRLFDSVPYRYAAGLWEGVYLIQNQSETPATYHFDYVDLSSASVGLYCQSTQTSSLPTLRLTNSRIHNEALYGLVLQHINAEIANTEISNCASYCVYLSGGEQRFVHTTIASYFNATNINIQSTSRQDVAAVYIDNLSKECPTTASFYNSIITGVHTNQLVVATPFTQYYAGAFVGNYLKTDTLTIPHAHNNIYWQATDSVPVFRNTYYKYKEYRYYDFRLDSLSPAIGIADSLTAFSYPLDKTGAKRVSTLPTDTIRPDAGCYQYQK